VFGLNYSPSLTETASFIEPTGGDSHYYYVCNLQPLQIHYYKIVDNGDGTFTITVSNNSSVVSGYQGTFVTDEAGVGYFTGRGVGIKIPTTIKNLVIH